MGRIEERLEQAGLSLPEVFSGPPGFERKFEFVRCVNDVAYISGHTPVDGSRLLLTGKVGDTVTPEQGYVAARATALSILASLKHELGELDRVLSWVKILGLVNAAPGFTRTAGVIDGCTDLIVELWGNAGRHARSAVGVAELPFNVPVEVEAVVQLAST